ncbi:unnamed protein product [Arctia plantaginis]|uniref:Uncharacterized protein n=1 Tax=Arctia plantaginis TaxID=874455 RepID=A0A8S1BKX6_ARCPL|nr:unnamed protein product [Arctia plantaginis]
MDLMFSPASYVPNEINLLDPLDLDEEIQPFNPEIGPTSPSTHKPNEAIIPLLAPGINPSSNDPVRIETENDIISLPENVAEQPATSDTQVIVAPTPPTDTSLDLYPMIIILRVPI